MIRIILIAASAALLAPGLASAHHAGHRGEWQARQYEKEYEHHKRRAAHHYDKAHEHTRMARDSARQAHRASLRMENYGQVLSVQPIYADHVDSQARYSCVQWNDDYNPRHVAWGPAAVGGVLGGALGYHLGKDHGDPEVATIAVGLLGAAAGHGIGRHLYDSRQIRVTGGCRPLERHRHPVEPVEYLVTYRYNGRIYRDYMDYDPGEWVRLNVEASPA